MYGIFQSTNIQHGKNFSFVAGVDLENGMVVNRGDLVSGSKTIYNALVPTTATMDDVEVYVIGNPAWNYDTSSVLNQNEENYINKSGKVFRVYSLSPSDKFAVTDYTIDGGDTLQVGHYVGTQNGTGRLLGSTVLPSTAFVGKVTRVWDLGAQYFVGQNVDQTMRFIEIEVVKNG